MNAYVKINGKKLDDIFSFSVNLSSCTYHLQFDDRMSFLEAVDYLKELEDLNPNKLIITYQMRFRKIIINSLDESIFKCELVFFE